MAKPNPLQFNLPEVVAEYEAGATMADIAEKYNCGLPTVSVTFKLNGIKARPRSYRKPKTWPITPEEAKRLYLEDKLSIYTIAEKYKMTCGRISQYLKDQQVVLRSTSEVQRIYSVDEHYFDEINTSEKAYWLGFFTADGYNNEESGAVCLSLAYADRAHVFAFKQALNSEHPVGDSKDNARFGVTGNVLRSSGITIHSRLLSRALAKWGCPQAKSFITYFPDIDAQWHSHFIRGLMDGDGSVSAGWSLAGTKRLLLQCQEVLMRACVLERCPLRTAGNIFVLNYGGARQLRRIYDYLYTGATICLQRKKDKFYALVKDVQSLAEIVI